MANVLISTAISVGLGLLQRALTPDTVTSREGARLRNSTITRGSEGATIPRIHRRMRVGGQLIWSTTFREETVITTQSTGGGKGGPRNINRETQFKYFVSFAVGICESEGGVKLNAIYLDGKVADLSKFVYRFYTGAAGQTPDFKIEQVEGAGTVPAFRGLCYIVFDEFPLEEYGNRIPQVTVEIDRALSAENPTSLYNNLQAVNMIPSSGEQIYGTTPFWKEGTLNFGASESINIHTLKGGTDIVESLNDLQMCAPNVNSVSLVVSWFGSSTDATVCRVEPKVENETGRTVPFDWRVSDRTRANAEVVSRDGNGNPIYGGTPSDLSVHQALSLMKSRGLRVVFYPFILMDSPGLPWRGRIEGDSTNFMGTAVPIQFAPFNGLNVPYFGPPEWTQRRMILHYARLCSTILQPGDAFLIGTEMVGLSRTDPAWGARLAALMADVRSMLPAGVLVSYAADWSEYKEPSLAAMWPSADFIGIDNYLPLTDWRTDADADYSIEHFMAGVEGREYWDYFYADDAARNANIKSPITQPQFRQKDIRWWRDNNYPGKEVWFTEYGCPAVDKGANQPNVFFDPKSSESFFPYFSNGTRNDAVQVMYHEAMLKYWTDDGFIDPRNMFAWTWDARPYPAFPYLNSVWSDGPNWELGHWLTGRLDSMTLARLVLLIMREAGFPLNLVDVTSLVSAGIQIQGVGNFSNSSVRETLENLMTTYSFDAFETGGVIRFQMRTDFDTIEIDLDELILGDDDGTFEKTRVQDTELPDRTKVTYVDETRAFQTGAVDGHTVTGYSDRLAKFDSLCVLTTSYARALADVLNDEKWVERDEIRFSLPISYYRIDLNDTFEFTFRGASRRYRVAQITQGDQLDIVAVGFSPAIYGIDAFQSSPPLPNNIAVPGRSAVIFADIPLNDPESPRLWSPRIIANQSPWPGGVAIYESDGSGGYSFNNRALVPGIAGRLRSDLPSSKTATWDNETILDVEIVIGGGGLSSASDLSVLNGANTLAIRTPSDEWEVLQFANAELIGDNTYRLSRLLRGRLGTEAYMGDPTPADSTFFVYDAARFSHIEGTDSRIGLDLDLRYGPINIDVSDDRFRDITVTPRGVALRPYSPVHLKQEKSGDNIVLTWIRRTRFGGDNWNVEEVPLNEETESYRVRVNGGVTVTVSTPTYVYTAAQQIADFGSLQDAVSWSVAQISATFGEGTIANA